MQGCSLRERALGVRGTDRDGVGAHGLLPAERGRVGRPRHDNRRVLNGILWAARSGARWALDRALYHERNWVERVIGRLKQVRRAATRYDQTAASFLATCPLAALRIRHRSVQSAGFKDGNCKGGSAPLLWRRTSWNSARIANVGP